MITLHDFMCDPKLAGRVFAAPSWNGWKAIACLLDGHTRLLDDGGKALVRELLGRDTLPTEVPDECFLIAPRRCGKTNFCAAVMAHGATIDHRARLQRGEWSTLDCSRSDARARRTR